MDARSLLKRSVLRTQRGGGVRRRGENAAWGMLGVALLALWCGCSTRVLNLDLPPRAHPIEPAVADAVRAGMTAEQIVLLAGEAELVGAGVRPVGNHPWGADVYHVFWDRGETHDRANGTWLYAIRSAAGPAESANERYLFVEMNAGVVSKAYQGRIGSWSM
jgi:hypothetical protein